MRAPPAVSVDAGPGAGWRVFQTLVHASTGAAVAAWTATWLEQDPVLPALAAAAAAAALGWYLSAAESARLIWSGAQWSMAADGRDPIVLDPPQVMVDLGGWVLLRLRAQDSAARHWLPVARAGQGAAWHLFRAAVYSLAPEPAPRSFEDSTPF